MRIDRRLTIVGVMLVVLSMTMATQYVTTSVGYSYALVHPSNADIRFVGYDNSSDRVRVLRTWGDGSTPSNSSGEVNLTLRFGNVSAGMNKSYTAAFAIVNEENFNVNITHVEVATGDQNTHLEIWVHRNPEILATSDGEAAFLWDNGATVNSFDETTCAWVLGPGDGNPNYMNGTQTETTWDQQAFVRFTNDTSAWASNGTSDFVWVQISINVPGNAPIAAYSGTISFHFRADTETSTD